MPHVNFETNILIIGELQMEGRKLEREESKLEGQRTVPKREGEEAQNETRLGAGIIINN